MSEIKPTQSQDDRMEHYLQFLQASTSGKASGVALHNQTNSGAAATKTAGIPAMVVGGINLSTEDRALADNGKYNCPECHTIMTPSLGEARPAGTRLSCDACGHTPKAKRTSQFRAPRRPDPTTDYAAANSRDVECPACHRSRLNPVMFGETVHLFCGNPSCGHMQSSEPD